MAQADCLLDIEGIKGESKDKKHPETIEVVSWSGGVSNAGSAPTGGGAGVGKASFSDFHFTSHINKASSQIFLACATGKHINKATLFCRKAGEEAQEYLVYTFTDLYISSYAPSGSDGAGLPLESFSFNFGKIEIAYKEQTEKGTLGASSPVGYDLKKGSKI